MEEQNNGGWTPPSDAVESKSNWTPPTDAVEAVKKKEPINGGEEVSVKESQTVSAPLSESGAKDSEPIGLPESYTNDRTNYKDLVGGQRYKLSRGGVPVTGYWDAENSVFVKDPLINLAPKEVPKGFIEEAASIIPSKKYESEEEVLARNFDVSQRAKQEAATKANAVNFVADLPVVQQLNKLAEESANDPEAAKQFEELANQPIGEGDFKGIRFEKGTEQKVFQNLTPNLPYEEYKGDQLQPLPLKSWLPEGYKDAKTVGDLYRFAKDDTQYINDVVKETRQFDEILTKKLISNLPQEKQDELKGLPYNSDEVQKALVESGETENVIKAAGVGLTNKLDALISVGSNIGLNDQEAEQKIRRELAYDQLFRVKPKGMAAEIASSVGGMLPDLTAGAVASPLMVASMASTMPQDFVKQYYQDAISKGETPKMSDAMKYAATSTATQMPLMLAAGVIGGKPIAIGNENLVNRAIQLISEVGQRGAKDAAVFGLGGHYLQNKVNEVYGVAKNDDYLKSAANMGIIGMLFGVKENIGKVFKESLPTSTRNEIDYIASYLPPEYTEQQVKQAVGKGMVTPSEGDATLKRMAAYRQIVAQLPTEITFKEAEKIYPLWEKKGELQKQRESATSEIRSVIDGQIEDIDKEILIAAGVPLSSSEKAEYNKLMTAQAEAKSVDKDRIDYLERRQESAKKKEDDNTNREKSISSEIGGREEPIEAEPIKEGGGGEAEGNRVVQAPQEEVAVEKNVEPAKEEGWAKDVESTAKALANKIKNKTPIKSTKLVDLVNNTKEKDLKIYNILSKRRFAKEFNFDLNNDSEYVKYLKYRNHYLEVVLDKIYISENSGKADEWFDLVNKLEDEYDSNEQELIDRNEIKGKKGEILGEPYTIAEQYHKAKVDGSNPELVKAVEDLLGKEEVKVEMEAQEPTETQPIEEGSGGEASGGGVLEKTQEVTQTETTTETVAETPTETVETKVEEPIKDVDATFTADLSDSELSINERKKIAQKQIRNNGITSEASLSLISRVLEKVEGLSVNNVFDLAKRIAKLDNKPISVEHIAEAIQYEVGRVEGEKDTFSLSIEDAKDVLLNWNKDAEPANKTRMDEIGIVAKSYRDRINKLKAAKKQYELLDDKGKAIIKTFLNRYNDTILEDAKLNTDEYLQILLDITKGRELVDVAENIQNAVRQIEDKEAIELQKLPPVKEPLKNKENTEEALKRFSSQQLSEIPFYDRKYIVKMIDEQIKKSKQVTLNVLPIIYDLPSKVSRLRLKENGDVELLDNNDKKISGNKITKDKFIEIALQEGNAQRKDAYRISEAYHKAKADGSNPELVKAVEDLLGKEELKVEMEAQEPTETPAEEAAETPEEQRVEAEEGIEEHAATTGSMMNNSWRNEFERAKGEGDLNAINKLYNKVKVALNGIAQSKGEETVKDFEALKNEIENYAIDWKKNKAAMPEAEKEAAPQAEQVTEEVVAPEPKPKKQKKESTKSEAGGLTFERRPTTMPDGEEGVELIIKSEDGTEKSGGKFYPEDTKEMERAERGHKLQAIKSSVKNAYAEFKAATDLDKMGAALDPEKHAEAMYKFHKQLVKAAKDYLAIGINDIKKFAREMGISVKNAVKAWDEANGHAKYGKEDLDYDMADIAKTAIRRGINVREKMKEYVAKRKSISEAIKAFVDDSEIKGNLSAGEIKQLIKRAANVTTDKQLDKFLDYAEKVVSDANYAESLDKLNSARKSAMKKRHNEKTGAVKRFLGQQIFDEDGNVLLDDVTFADYVEAVNALNQRIPDHSLMEAKDATGKTLAERVEEQSAASNPYNSMNTMEQLSKAWNRLDNKIDSIESYRSFARNVNKIRARLRELVDNGTITEEQYRDAVDQIYKLEDGKRVYEGKFADQINDLKDAQLADAQAKMRNVDDSGFNKIQKALWDEFKRNMKVNYEKVKKLDVGDLDKLNTVLDRMEAGFMPEYELRDISNKIETEGQGKKVAAQVSGISKRFKAMGDEFKKLLTMTNPARYEGELGIAGDSSLWKYVTGRTQKALQAYTQSAHDLYQKWYNGLPSFYKITSKKPIVIDRYGYEGKKAGKFVTNKREYDMTKAGIVRHMINHAAEMEAKGEKPVDFFGQQLESAKDRQAYENNDQLSILEDVYRKLKEDKSLLDDEGNLDYVKVKESVDNNDGRVLDKDQAQLEKLFGDIDKDTGEMISSANALRGVNATDNPTHIKRIYLGDRIREGKISEGEQVGVRAGSSYERVIDKPKGAMELNLENVVQRQIRDAAKDYHLNEELDRQKLVFDDARKAAKEEDLNTLDILQNDQRDLMKYHLTTELPPWWNKLQGGLYAKLLLTPYRMVAEAVSNTAQMFLRGKSLRGLLTAVPSEKINPAFKQMTDVMRATGSTALDHAEFRSMGNLELKDGKINRESLLKRGVEVINGVTNAMGIGGIWMPNFLREFEKITGEKFNYQKHMVDEKDSYLDAAKEASMYADREAETVVGSTVKGGGRRVVEVLPGVGLKADRIDGAIAKFLSEYPYRDTKELIRGIKQMATNSNEGRMDGLARAMGVVTNMMLYSGIYAITKAVWNSNFGDDRSKKEAEKTIKGLSTKEGMIDFAKNEAIANAAATAGSRYSQAGKLITQIGLTALYNSDMLDDKEKKNLSDFTEAQMFFKIPKIKTGKSAYERNQIGQLALRMIPLMNEAVDIVTKELGGEEGIVAFMKEIKDTPIEKMTTDQKAKLSLIKNFVNSVNLILMTQGTQLPFSKDFVKALDAQIKELK